MLDAYRHNMFPEEELEALLHLVERLNSRISTIDDLGLLDASVLGEVVHPRTFNTIRRIRAEDGAVLDEEETRAELTGPEMLLKQLKDLLNRDGANVHALPPRFRGGLLVSLSLVHDPNLSAHLFGFSMGLASLGCLQSKYLSE
jgi:hypothetical protein